MSDLSHLINEESIPARLCFFGFSFPVKYFSQEQIFHKGLLVGTKIILLPSPSHVQVTQYACHGLRRLATVFLALECIF